MSLVFPVLTEPVPAPPNKRGAGPNLPIRTSGEPGGTRTRDPMIKSYVRVVSECCATFSNATGKQISPSSNSFFRFGLFRYVSLFYMCPCLPGAYPAT
jgi:hypothetical protein